MNWLAPSWPRPVPPHPIQSAEERLADLIENVDAFVCAVATRDDLVAALKRARG